ncbi:MAG: hypothetical protein ACRD2J_10035 [Thermoanaerobaculia bacterium]
MTEEWTCGMGLAQNADLPSKLGELMAARAVIFEKHAEALDRDEEEYPAYESLARHHRDVASRLQAIGREMTGYVDLPQASHDTEVLSSRANIDAFAAFVAVEEEILAMVQMNVERDREMLREFKTG